MKKVKTIIKNKNHWKTYFDHEYIGGFSLTDMDAVVTINKYAQEIVKNEKLNTETVKFILYVQDKEKEHKMILNSTNGRAIETALNTPDPDKWIGQDIQLFTERGTWFGEQSDALRVRNIAPTKVIIDIEADLKALKSCKTMEDLVKVYKACPNWKDDRVVALKDKLKTEL